MEKGKEEMEKSKRKSIANIYKKSSKKSVEIYIPNFWF